jgi:(p)ppGpp synthase/HD superfamily hydrolase
MSSKFPHSKSEMKRLNAVNGRPLNEGEKDFDLVRKARELAASAHKDQKYGELPYTVHLEDVVRVLGRFNYHKEIELLIGAWLHDVVEDTSVTVDDIQKLFGENISDIVYRVTDEDGSSRKERKARTYPKIHGHRGATIVKLCDRIANVEGSVHNPIRLSAYRGEQEAFRAAVKVDGIADELWQALEDLLSS